MRPLLSCLILLSACKNDPEPADDIALEIPVSAKVGTLPAACGTDYTLGSSSATVQLADARVFLSGIEVRDSEGNWTALTLDESDWQHEGIALLDFEDGTAACADSGTSQLNGSLKGTVPDGTYDAVRFDVGVPDALNHNDSASAPAPLNNPGMFWTWQGGYKHLRVDFMGAARWNVHVGSTGCASASPVTPPEAPCVNPNRATIELDLDPMTAGIEIDLAALVADADVAVNTPDTAPGCMSTPGDSTECNPVFDALGLDFAAGTCVAGCADQTVFAADL